MKLRDEVASRSCVTESRIPGTANGQFGLEGLFGPAYVTVIPSPVAGFLNSNDQSASLPVKHSGDSFTTREIALLSRSPASASSCRRSVSMVWPLYALFKLHGRSSYFADVGMPPLGCGIRGDHCSQRVKQEANSDNSIRYFAFRDRPRFCRYTNDCDCLARH